MKNIISFYDKSKIQAEAATWFAVLHRGELSQQRRAELLRWLQKSPRHGAALVQMADLWDDMNCLSLLSELLPLEQPRTLINWRAKTVVGGVLGIAASAMFAVVVLWSFNAPPLLPDEPNAATSQPYELVYQTQLGEQSRALLDDGSSILLNTETTVKVRYSDTERAVELVGGEALFEVAKNPLVPFVVYAGNGSIRAVGTAFSVRVDRDSVGVTVTEGTVEVLSGKPDAALDTDKTVRTSVTLNRNGEAYYRDSIENVAYVEPRALVKKLAWKTGKWLFEGERLADVIAEANRYLDVKLVIADPTIADLQVGGYFDVGDVGPLLSALEKGLGVTALPQNGSQIALIASEHY